MRDPSPDTEEDRSSVARTQGESADPCRDDLPTKLSKSEGGTVFGLRAGMVSPIALGKDWRRIGRERYDRT